MSSKVPVPSHRHAAPSAPWPFVDIDDEVDRNRIEDPDSHLVLSAAACDHKQTPGQEICWCKYPQSLYPNWTPRQQKKAKLTKLLEKRMERCAMYCLDVNKDASFVDAGKREVNARTLDSRWKEMQEGRPQHVHLRALFIEGLSGNMLQMLGTRYNLEPFFFSSTVGWIPSRHQSNVVPNESDHITITLTFIRPMTNPMNSVSELIAKTPRKDELEIDTHAPLPLRSNNILLADQLALHMVRSRTSNTIISLHPSDDHRATSARTLHSRVHAAGRSVHWGNILKDTTDPTFVLLTLLWYALYAWDEALEHLYNHICFLESEVISTNDALLTQELHVLSAHLLYFDSLLEDFKKTVEFLRSTPNESLQPSEGEQETVEQLRSRATMEKECDNMLNEIDRLERSRNMQSKRVKNVMELLFSMVNIEDSRGLQKLTEATMRDSSAVKQLSYLTMAFVPAAFVANVFGMNVAELNPHAHGTLAHFAVTAVPLTIFTFWIIVAYQIRIKDPQAVEVFEESVQTSANSGSEGLLQEHRAVVFRRLNLWERLMWPAILTSTMMERRKRRQEMRKATMRVDTSANPSFTIKHI